MVMTDLQLANLLQFFAIAGVAIFIFCKMIPDSRLETFRQKMFVVRDEFFDYAAEGHISFDHPAYILLRRQMNGFIRYGHNLSLFRIIMTILIHKTVGVAVQSDWHESWQRALNTVKDESVRNELQEFYRREMVLAIGRLIEGSPVLWAMTLVFTLDSVFKGVRQTIGQLAKNGAKKAFKATRINVRFIEDAARGEFA